MLYGFLLLGVRRLGISVIPLIFGLTIPVNSNALDLNNGKYF